MNVDLEGIYIDQRDLELFPYLFAVKIATYEQIQRDIYPDISVGRVGQRIRVMEDNRLLSICRSRLILRGKRTVSLRKRGFDTFVKTGTEKRTELTSDAPLHDLVLGDIRHRFLASSRVSSYKTENEIQTWGGNERKLNSDALASVSLANGSISVPVEFERSQKRKKSYDRLVKQYYESDATPLVFLISEKQATIDAVVEAEKKLFNWDKPKFFYLLKSDFLAQDELKLRNSNGITINLMQSSTQF